jgi:probable rRNA maturation factor
MKLDIDNRLGRFRLHRTRLERVATAMGRRLGLPADTRVSLVLCSSPALSRLGERHFGRPGTTDIIAFPTGFPGLPGLLGELWIAPETVARNGLKFGKGLDGEFLFVFAHGLLHLLGEDDATERQRAAMFARQEQLVAACPGPRVQRDVAIERTGSRCGLAAGPARGGGR